MEGSITTKEQHLRQNDHQISGYSSPAPLFDPKLFKANREVRNVSCKIHARRENPASLVCPQLTADFCSFGHRFLLATFLFVLKGIKTKGKLD